jgi:hypothetical protein
MSHSGAWTAYGERDSELAVCAFKNEEHLKMFKSHYGTDAFEDFESAAKYAYGAQGLFEKELEFIGNYTS